MGGSAFMFKKLSKFILDLFFPKKCFGCNKPGTYICDSCFKKIEIDKNNKCPFCDRPVPNTFICQKCRERFYLDRLIWAVPYFNPLVKKLIKAFKYHHIKELAKPLSALLIKSLNQCGTSYVPDNVIVVPIPLHNQRLHERDFNQAELLSKNIAEYFSIPMETEILERTRSIIPQAKIRDHKSRRENIKDIFEIKQKFIKKCKDENKNLLKGKIIILVDDVFTSGATISEATRILKRAGAKEIWGLVIAKG